MKTLFIAILILAFAGPAPAAVEERKLLSAWSTDCANLEESRWFALESVNGDRYRFTLCAGFTCIPYPGFREPFDVYHDPRIRWLSDTRMEVHNDDKDAGWEGFVGFDRCREY